MNILGLETSCDDTSAAVLRDRKICSNIVSSQQCHLSFGGIVPELASREHERLIVSIADMAIQEANIEKNELDIIAATAGPGLIGAVMVGLCFAQGLAWSLGIPFIPVNHIEGHIFSPFIPDHEENQAPATPPERYISLTVSGGHTLLALVSGDLSYRVIGRTLDDAAGEAFDKTGKMLGLPYPAGPVIDRLAKEGDPSIHVFPRALMTGFKRKDDGDDALNFSFSGLKTAVLIWLQQQEPRFIETHMPDIAAAIQSAIVDVLVTKTIRAARRHRVSDIAIAGGVSANSGLRDAMKRACQKHGMRLHLPKQRYTTDNAAMIATLAELKVMRGMEPQHAYNVAPYARFEAAAKTAHSLK